MNMNGGIKSPFQIPLTNEEQAAELAQSIKCKLGQSKVHGVGVVTMRDIKKGDKLYCALTVKPNWYSIPYNKLKKYLEAAHPEILQIILERWPHVYHGQSFISPNYDARLTSFMNHRDTPNYDPITDLALEDIPLGGEVFCDYRIVPDYEKIFPWLTLSTEK